MPDPYFDKWELLKVVLSTNKDLTKLSDSDTTIILEIMRGIEKMEKEVSEEYIASLHRIVPDVDRGVELK